ncbi:UNVERIFIED_ORG: hypothetical protein GGE64_006094 [Rhizobium etli]|nr:hypothetical protein [Rhizobium leguminosarum]
MRWRQFPTGNDLHGIEKGCVQLGMDATPLFEPVDDGSIERCSRKQDGVPVIGRGNGEGRTHDACAQDEDGCYARCPSNAI